ncbi:MAG: hypothetical protein AAGM67_09570, partial [Bacteroidota bacterium]
YLPDSATSTPNAHSERITRPCDVSPVRGVRKRLQIESTEGVLTETRKRARAEQKSIPESPGGMTTRAMKRARNKLLLTTDPQGPSTSTAGPSHLRDQTDEPGDDDLLIDYDGTYFLGDPTANSSCPADYSLDLLQMEDYYHLGFFPTDPASISQMNLSQNEDCCFPKSHCRLS